MTVERKRAFLINTAFAALILAIVFLAIKYVIGWIAPFIIGMVVAAILQKPIRWLSRKTHIKSKICAVLCVFFILTGLCFVLFLLGQKIVTELSGLLNYIPKFANDYWPIILSNISTKFSNILNTLPVDMANQVRESVNHFSGSMTTHLVEFATSTGTEIATLTASKLPGLLVNMIITIVACCFISADFETIRDFLMRQLSPRWAGIVSEAKNFFTTSIAKLLKAYLILMTLTFLELAVFLTIFGVDYSISLAALIAVIDILPVLGVGTVLIPWALVTLVLGNWTLALCLALLYVGITIIRQALEPKIVGEQIGLHPVVTLFFMYLGLQFIGFLGMFLFPLTIIILKKLQDNDLIHIWK